MVDDGGQHFRPHIIDSFINRVIPLSQLLKPRYVLIFCDRNCSGSPTSDEMALVATYISGRDIVVSSHSGGGGYPQRAT